MNSQLPLGFTARPAMMEDVEDVVAVINAYSHFTVGTERINISRQKRWWEVSGVDLTADSQVILSPNGQIVGYTMLEQEENVIHLAHGVVRPEYREQGLGTYLLRWAEERSRAKVDEAPKGARVIMRCHIYEADKNGQSLLLREGYHLARRYVHLQLHMDTPLAPPSIPAGITIRPVGPKDWTAVFTALEEAFHDHWGVLAEPLPPEPEAEDDGSYDNRSEESKAYFNTPGLCFMAMDGDTVVGSALCNAKVVEFSGAGRLGSLSVRRSWRRRGIGLALTLCVLNEFYHRGIRHIVTDTDADNFTRSYLLYAKVGMTPFRYEALYEKEIRPGRDLLRRSMEGNG